jgi:hypothetical protein
MTYKADSLSDWPMQVHNGKQVYGEAQLFVLRDGKWTGGKFDHVHPNGDWRDFKNVVGEHKGYLSITPVSGEPVRYRMVSYDGKSENKYVGKRLALNETLFRLSDRQSDPTQSGG